MWLLRYTIYLLFLSYIESQFHPHGHGIHAGGSHAVITNKTLSGIDKGCPFRTPYYITHNVQVPMCMGHTNQDMKNGMSIINLVNSRGYLPTCRVMHLMLWMASMVTNRGPLPRDYFVDIGANIGSCTVHMAGLGFPVISVEPVQEHVDAIKGTIDINPAFHIDLQHIGLSSADRHIRANFGHGGRNWGASEFHEVGENDTAEAELTLKTLDHVIGHRRVALLKIDCEGCEWETLKSARKTLRRIPMIKMELVQQEYTAGNETMTPYQIVQFLNQSNFELFMDHWNEQDLYFGRHHEKIMDIDHLFGSAKFNLGPNVKKLKESAALILGNPIDPATFDHRQFLRQATDIIAIERSLSNRMKQRWLHSN